MLLVSFVFTIINELLLLHMIFVRNEVWVTFPRQEQAISYQKEHSNVFIFSYQDHVNGQRRFVVSSYKEFWRRFL